MFGLIVEPISEVTRKPVPMSRRSSACVCVPWVRAMFQTLGEGALPVPRAALAVLFIPSLRALARSSVQPSSTPSRTMWRGAVGRPSASNGRDAEVRGRCGSSTIERCLGRTSSPRASRSHEEPRATIAPLTAASRWPTSVLEMRSSKRIG